MLGYTPGAMSQDSTPASEGGALPIVLVGGAVLLAGAALVFWPDSSGPEPTHVGAAEGGAAGGKSGAARSGGVAPRAYDQAQYGDATRPRSKVNPAIKLPSAGVAEGPAAPPEPPEFQSKDDEIAWYRKRLEQARSMLEFREKNVQRLDKIRDQIDDSPNPDEARRVYEQRKQIVEDNLDKAKQKIEDLERRLAELEG